MSKIPICNTCSTPLLIGKNWTSPQRSKSNYKCNSCRAEYQRVYHYENRKERILAQKKRYVENKEDVLKKQKYYNIQKQYGLSEEDYHELIDGAVCSICEKDNDLVIDHCHSTGDVRGVLCRQCNCALGLLKDNTSLLLKSVEYLDNNNKGP